MGGPEAGSPKSVLGFLTLSSLFPGFPSHSDGILARFQLGKCLKYIYYEKSADFCITVEAGVVLRLQRHSWYRHEGF